MRNLVYLLPLFFVFFLSLCFFGESVVVRNGSAESKALFHVGLVLDLKSKIGEMAESCISMALSDFYDIHINYSTRLELHTQDSRGDSMGATSAALYLMKDVEVQAIIGPQQSTQASFVIDLGEKAQVPIVSFSTTSPSLSPLKSTYFIRTAIDESTQVKAINAIIQAFEWKEVVLIHEDTDYGNGVIPYFINVFQEFHVRVPYRSSIPMDANDDEILKELYNLKTMQTRVFIVHMSSSVGFRLFSNADKAGMMSEGYAWIVTTGLSSLLSPMDSNDIYSMEGVLGVRPYIPKSIELEEFKVRWKRRYYSNKSYAEISEPNLYGIWAYDTVWALAMAVELVGTLDPHFLSLNTNDNLTELSGLGYSTIGPRLLQAILSTRFKGLSGDFHLVKGQLKSSTFQIFNVIGEGERVIGYWTPTGDISRQLNSTNESTYSTSISNLKAIVWPGDSTAKPKGWAIPTNGKAHLKVLVPITSGFYQFVNVEDTISNKTINPTGFCIELFDNIISRLPFGLSYEYQAYPLDRKPLDSYNEIVDQVHFKNFDVAVGDISITENRSKYVDFTIPYSESGVTMVVPVKDSFEKEAWMFLKPLSLNLWMVTMAGFIYIGVVMWILEHPTNSTLGVSRGERLQTSLWYSFFTLIFAQREKIENNLTRAVLLTWVFFVLILTQSYTASLSSMLTVQQLQPTLTDVHEIKKNGYYVGYQKGSFVEDFLTQHLHLNKYKLKGYDTPEEYHYALSNGTHNGGVAAIFDVLPNIQVFLNMYRNNYTKVGRMYSSEGFGFVFPKGSPLVSYVSMAILNLTDDGTLDIIKQQWLENQTTYYKDAAAPSTNQLTLQSFGGLFLIIGVVSGLSLLIHLFLFVYGKWPAQATRISPKSRWQKAGYRIIYITNALKGMQPITEVGSMELQRRDAEHREEDIVIEEGGEAEHREAGIVEEGGE